MKLTRTLVITLMLALTSITMLANAATATHGATTPHKKITHQYRRHARFPYFDAIEADGCFQLEIHQGAPNVEIVGQNLDWVHEGVEGGTLYLTIQPPPDYRPSNEPVTVAARAIITMPDITNIHLSGNSSLSGAISSQHLNIEVDDDSQVRLYGTVDVRNIIVNDSSTVDIKWVKSPYVSVEGHDDSSVRLAGVTNLLQARMDGDSVLDAKYLRSKTIFVQTVDNALAEVLPLKSLSAFASDESNVYYYRSSYDELDHSEISGNVLQLGYSR